MKEIKQTEESQQGVPVERPAKTASPADPAHSPVKRTTEKKAKDQKNKVTAGHAGAAARQKRLFEQLLAAKESLRPQVSTAYNDGSSSPPKEAKPPKHTNERPVIIITGSHGS